MDFMALANSLWQQFVTVWNAPVPFIAAVLLSWFVIWKIIRREFANRLADAASRLELAEARVGDYERKLSGASPDEARAEIQALQEAVRRLQPRQLTGNDLAAITHAAQAAPSSVTISCDMAYAAGQRMAAQMQRAFAAAGWQVSGGIIGGPGFLPPEGLAVSLSSANERTPSEQALCAALEAASLRYAVRLRSPDPHTPDSIEMVFTQPDD